ncbi:carbonic anhydrase [Malassezia cuniculi]|uniref:Carbonic anhydrase n=1 Tax=Malassezia cuniculi TaxID=948313 RepID=A0AAF0EPL4_9BASI|nr:carbonic anhydrase [Malassezia cuniculi]
MSFSKEVPESLLTRNATWSNAFIAQQPDLASALEQGQHPKVFWIGCSDSRVPESVVCNARPGELFVMRNVANQFHAHDDSAVSALTFAVQALGVEHVIVVGHTGCGGVSAAIKQVLSEQNDHEIPPMTALYRHLSPLTQLARHLRARIRERYELSDEEMHDRLVPLLTEASVRHQIQTILEHPVIKDNWAQKVSPLNGKVNPRVTLHGWIHNIKSGKLADLNYDIHPPPLDNDEGEGKQQE